MGRKNAVTKLETKRRKSDEVIIHKSGKGL